MLLKGWIYSALFLYPMHVSNFRLSKRYRIINHGEVYEFSVVEFLENNNFRFKDLNTLEEYSLQDIVRYGKGRDFEIQEL